MKKSIFSLMLLGVIAFFTACNSGSSPKSVAEKFLTATGQMKFEEAKKYCTPETGKLLDMMSGFASMAPDSVKNKKPDFTMTGEKIDGDAATVTYKEKGHDKESSIKLKKVDGKWLVAMGKEDMKGKDDKSDKPAAGGDSKMMDSSSAPAGGDTTKKGM